MEERIEAEFICSPSTEYIKLTKGKLSALVIVEQKELRDAAKKLRSQIRAIKLTHMDFNEDKKNKEEIIHDGEIYFRILSTNNNEIIDDIWSRLLTAEIKSVKKLYENSRGERYHLFMKK